MPALIAVIFIFWILDFVFKFVDSHFLIFGTPLLLAGGAILFLGLATVATLLSNAVTGVVRSAYGKRIGSAFFTAVFTFSCAYYANDWVSAPYAYYRDVVAGTLAKRTEFMKAEGDAAYKATKPKTPKS